MVENIVQFLFVKIHNSLAEIFGAGGVQIKSNENKELSQNHESVRREIQNSETSVSPRHTEKKKHTGEKKKLKTLWGRREKLFSTPLKKIIKQKTKWVAQIVKN
jgi:hypothetical protein